MFGSAKTQLANDGFKVKETMVQSSQPVGTVTAQSAAGQAPKGSTITLTVSSGPATVQVPDVHLDNEAQAGAQLNNAKLVIGTVKQQGSTTVPSGEVISTSPPANTPVPLNSTVNQVVSSGQPTASVPSVTGLSASTAQSLLTGEGFKVAPLTYQTVTDPTQDQLVISQSPAASSTQQLGTTVTLTIGEYLGGTTTTTLNPFSTTTTFPSFPTTTFPTTPTTDAGGGGLFGGD
jgi:serine/threonine-protein kinase